MEVMLFEVGWVGKASLMALVEQRPERREGGSHVTLWALHSPPNSVSFMAGQTELFS